MDLSPKDLIFYKIMNYPIPIQKEFFVFGKKIKETNNFNYENFSREDKNEYIDIFLKKIEKYGKLYKSIPFVSEIYLCNSISFNALKEDSDIDIFIITKKNSIRRARFFSTLYFTVLGLKRSKKNKKQKFCLSFYITENNKNLYNVILKNKIDIYLAYRLGHLIPLYQEKENNNGMYKENPRLKSYLPNHPEKYCINIGNKKIYGNTGSKKVIEKILGGYFGILIENFIKVFWRPILKNKVKKLGNKGKRIVINDNMLKFHDDIREEISEKYKESV